MDSADGHHLTPTKSTLSQRQSSAQQLQHEDARNGEVHESGPDRTTTCGTRDWTYQDDRLMHGIHNRPPTPDIRRSDLDLADLSNGTRVLVIQDTHLRAGTLFLGSSSSTSSPSPIALPPSSLRDQLFRIQLDSERPAAHPGSPRFTSLPSPSRISLTPGRRISSPAWATSTNGGAFGSTTISTGTAGTPKKRRQSDLILYGWQVVQQAVLEVFPASVRHVPPGTRVCAAWSEQLAADLYPGTVAQAEPKEEIQPNCVPVSFDDGDRRQVSVPHIRILPDHFTNLYELASVTNDPGGLGRSDLLPSVTDFNLGVTSRQSDVDQAALNGAESARPTTTGRVRHHSAIDQPCTRMNSSNLTEFIRSKRAARTVQRVPSISVQRERKSEPPDSPMDQVKFESVSDKKEASCSSARYPTEPTISGQPSSFERVSSPASCSSSQKRRHPSAISPTLSALEECPSDEQSVPNSGDAHMHDEAFRTTKLPLISTPDEPSAECNLNRLDRHSSPLMDNEVLSDTVSTTSSASEQQPVWHILDKVRRRKQRGVSCRSIVRQTDGLIISIGDSVEFSSGHDEVYLGEVRAIRWDDLMDAPVVIAAWYYNMSEAGADGERLMQFKGAVFATEHHDENEARCILRRVHVAPSYAAYQTLMHAAGCENGQTENAGSKPTVKPDPDAVEVSARAPFGLFVISHANLFRFVLSG
ncbi:unnamed protein product [Echinostoma caproni]|uniref:BAH domain-containing protein n=1 Tax=Echinostoma caproni TaxID=27848 RepID=A0A183AS32_9TREM|nr:unnamed protein product [Echinostoma caproni]